MITTTTIAESIINYGIVNAVWVIIRWVVKRTASDIRKERNRIIRNHIKADHEGRLKHCLDEACASLRRSKQPVAQEMPEAVWAQIQIDS